MGSAVSYLIRFSSPHRCSRSWGLFRSAYVKDQGSIDGLRLCPVLATPWLTVEGRDRALQRILRRKSKERGYSV